MKSALQFLSIDFIGCYSQNDHYSRAEELADTLNMLNWSMTLQSHHRKMQVTSGPEIMKT